MIVLISIVFLTTYLFVFFESIRKISTGNLEYILFYICIGLPFYATLQAQVFHIFENEIFVNLLPRVGIEYTYLDLYYFRGGLGNGRIAFGWGLEYDLIKDNDSRIDYTFSMDWASQLAHTFSYAFNF